MTRVNVHLPNHLAEQVRAKLPGVNVSAVLQNALREMLECPHERLTCGDCGDTVDRRVVAGEAMAEFWRELLWEWESLVDKGGTAVGAAQVGKQVAVRLGVPRAETMPLPRPARSRPEPV